jgi:hypothetical protein
MYDYITLHLKTRVILHEQELDKLTIQLMKLALNIF